MNRRGFVGAGCACGLTLLGAPVDTPAPASDDLTIPVNPEQVMSFLKSVDSSGDEALRSAVFTRWGYQCCHSGQLEKWTLGYRGKIENLAADINQGRSRYWEKIEYDKAAGTVKVTSQQYPHCVCPWAQCPQPPKSLCTHCCRAFNIEVFRVILERKVDAVVTESLLLGGQRCRVTVRILPS